MIIMWVYVLDDSEEGKVYKKWVDVFNKKYVFKNVKVKIEFILCSGNGGGYEDKVNVVLIMDILSDVIILDGLNMVVYVKLGIIVLLDDYVKE